MTVANQTIFVYVAVAIATTLVIECYPVSEPETKIMCNQIPEPVLSEILGPAFNSRYMSIDQPFEIDMDAAMNAASSKRAPSAAPSFYVDDHFAQEISEMPAWNTDHYARGIDGTGAGKVKRAVKPGGGRQWECEAKIRWQDLGPDYFPRYLRSVDCTSKSCWYDMLKCKPRSFTVKLLRRKRNQCVNDGLKVGVVGLPQDLRELWVWEERAVNFCCDCAL
ncbi:trunk [Carabus blaptoides fortunei]